MAPAVAVVEAQSDRLEVNVPMSVSGLLADLLQRGVILRLSQDRTRIVAPRHRLSPEERARLRDDKREILALLAYADEYRALIRNAFAAMTARASASSGLRELADDQARLIDELGVDLASAIRDGEARQWRHETGLCPACGDDKDCAMCLETDQAGAED
ncbi:MAG TPA: hypothetical protein VFV05_18480 [Methylomirabilota bacterium]|nr:hypothetical protein [Methylomirabilota bacterium]